jgi:hypothetical protein
MAGRWWTSLGGGAGAAIALVLWQGLARALPVDVTATQGARLGVACAALLPAVGVLNLMILVQMRLRARSGAVDPLAGRDTAALLVNQRVLTNTVEQLAGFAPGLLALGAGAAPGAMRLVVSAGVVFALARLVFWGGYLLGPLFRAPGMAATFAINLATLVSAIWVWWP